MAQAFVSNIIQGNKVALFSKTYCGYCARVKSLFKKIGVSPYIVELDERGDGDQIQAYLAKLTGGTTVPRVFINGKFIGGCDDTHGLHSAGKLIPLLQEAGVQVQGN